MRISPKSLLQGLLYLAPVTLLALASCGGGGGTTATLAANYPLSVSVTGISGVVSTSGVVLRNGGENLPAITTPGTYTFTNQVLSGSTYNISVLSQPSNTTQLCTFTGNTSQCDSPNGTACVHAMPASAKTVTMNCAPAFTLGGTINIAADGMVLQNNGADNYQFTAGNKSLNFSTPLIANANYNVTILRQPLNPAETCNVTSPGPHSIGSSNLSITNIVTCSMASSRPEDPFVYVTNSGTTNNAYAFKSASGVLDTPNLVTHGSGRAAIAAVGGKYVLIASNGSTNSIASYSINSTTGALTYVSGALTGNAPFAIAVHPSGSFAYVVNEVSNTITAYSVGADGTLASMYASPTAATITTLPLPVAIAIDPSGNYAYVANVNNTSVCGVSGSSLLGCISAYKIDPDTGALTLVPANSGGGTYIPTGIAPSSIAIDPSGKYLYATNLNDTIVSEYTIGTGGALTGTSFTTGAGSSSIAISPDGNFAYVALPHVGQVSEYPINTGLLTPLLTSTNVVAGSYPNSVSIDSSGKYAYIANYGTYTVSAYSISAGGTVNASPISTPSAPAGTGPVSVITAP
jgi:6-phosphogluconolactonase